MLLKKKKVHKKFLIDIENYKTLLAFLFHPLSIPRLGITEIYTTIIKPYKMHRRVKEKHAGLKELIPLLP